MNSNSAAINDDPAGLPVCRTVRRKCAASKFNRKLRRTVQRYGVRRTNTFVIYAGRSGVKA